MTVRDRTGLLIASNTTQVVGKPSAVNQWQIDPVKNRAREARRKVYTHKRKPGSTLTQVEGTVLTKNEASKHNLFGKILYEHLSFI